MKRGIYQIKNTVSGKIYIGSAKNIEKRLIHHRCHLRRGTHVNRILQRAWNKYGESSFECSVLESVSEEGGLLEVEQKYLDDLRPFERARGYNICSVAGRTTGIPVSLQTRQKIGRANAGRKMPPRTSETRRKLSDSMKGKPKSEDHIAKMAAAKRVSARSIAQIERLASVRRGQKQDPESVAKMAAALRHLWLVKTDEERAGQLATLKAAAVLGGKSHRGKRHSDETKKKQSASIRRAWKEGRLSGRPHTEESRRKIAAAHHALWARRRAQRSSVGVAS